ncbi:MAG: ABC transporter permease subunit [Ilumatobacter sp.]|nr:ABC transporter permease subunit [Ilumatobacter sp.]
MNGAPVPTAPPPERGAASIVARGFQRYDGERSGVGGAIRSVAWQSIRATLGIGRAGRNKVFPVISVAISYIPAIVFIGIAVLVPSGITDGPTYAEYYGFITAAIVLFAALVAPEVLVSDRRNGMLALYLSTPLHRGTYLASKVLAVAATLGLVTLGPPILVLLGYTFDGSGPDGLRNWLVVLARIVLSGVAISAALTSISMAASCLTDRRAFAAIGVVLLVLASPILASALVDGAELSANWRLLDVFSMPFELVFRIFGERGNFPEVSTAAVVAVNAAWTAAGLAVVVWRYSRFVISR